MLSDNLYFAIDLGEVTSKLVVGSVYNNRIHVCATFTCKTQGMKDGMIASKSELQRTVSQLIDQARQADFEVKEMIVILPTTRMNVYRKRASNSVNSINRVVGSRDIELLRRACGHHQIDSSELVVGIYPIQYFINNENLKRVEPLGYRGDTITLDAYVVTLPNDLARGIIDMIQELGILVLDAIVSSVAYAKALLQSQELASGAILFDFGGSHNSISFFFDGLLCAYKEGKIGGNQLTERLAAYLQCDMIQAESVKMKYGIASVEGASNIGVYRNKVNNTIIKENEIAAVMEDGINELIKEVDKNLKYVINEKTVPLIITGGGANIEAIDTKFTTALQMKCMVRDLAIVGGQDAIFCGCIGGLQFYIERIAVSKPVGETAY